MARHGAALILGLAVMIGCGQAPEPPMTTTEVAEVDTPAATWAPVAVDGMTPEQLDTRGRCLAAKDDLMMETKAELVAALEIGTEEAIGVCSIRAPEIAALVSNRHGVVMGRTSFKLRNLANTPPDWATAAVEARLEEEQWYRAPDGRMAGLLPIRMAAPCLQCHGPVEGISEGTRREIVELYPADQAVGFAEGDLRGWVWVEAMPAAPTT
jgi:hypothetical protein